MQFTKFAFAAALCTMFVVQAEARTLYVDASRPNNKGNGLKLKTAKKTIQAAVNIAKNGDTIVVYPGTYSSPLTTKGKKITVKSKAGKAKTIVRAKSGRYAVNSGGSTASKFKGFAFECGGFGICAAKGGTFTNCDFSDTPGSGEYWESGGFGRVYDFIVTATFEKAKLAACLITACYNNTAGMPMIRSCTLDRCRITGNSRMSGTWSSKSGTIVSSKFYNCLLNDNDSPCLEKCELLNCTVAENDSFTMKASKAYNTVFYGVAASQFKKARKNTLKNCYKGANPKFVAKKTTKTVRVEVDEYADWDTEEYDADAGCYRYYSEDTVAIPGDYRLAHGSPCINKGKLTAAQKKQVGKKDLGGKKRIKGKIDIGCYEY